MVKITCPAMIHFVHMNGKISITPHSSLKTFARLKLSKCNMFMVLPIWGHWETIFGTFAVLDMNVYSNVYIYIVIYILQRVEIEW